MQGGGLRTTLPRSLLRSSRGGELSPRRKEPLHVLWRGCFLEGRGVLLFGVVSQRELNQGEQRCPGSRPLRTEVPVSPGVGSGGPCATRLEGGDAPRNT